MNIVKEIVNRTDKHSEAFSFSLLSLSPPSPHPLPCLLPYCCARFGLAFGSSAGGSWWTESWLRFRRCTEEHLFGTKFFCVFSFGFESPEDAVLLLSHTRTLILCSYVTTIVGLSLTPLFPFSGVGSTEQRKWKGDGESKFVMVLWHIRFPW
jgi:hypothetical protein